MKQIDENLTRVEAALGAALLLLSWVTPVVTRVVSIEPGQPLGATEVRLP